MHARANSFTAVVPTRNRSLAFERTLKSLAAQSVQPEEIVVIDASDDFLTRELCIGRVNKLRSKIRWVKAATAGAAAQRNQGVAMAAEPFICFMDDDILFEPDCMSRLWRVISSDERLGGVNAMITNQKYQPPGKASRSVFRLMGEAPRESYAGCVLGPAVNFLPDDNDKFPDLVAVDWLNTTCTLYRKEALPTPPFPDHFTGYSLMEDLTLSLTVGKKWKLANARTARIFHDSQPGSHKSDPSILSEMDLVNRHYVMTKVMGKRRVQDFFNLILWTLFCHMASMRNLGGVKRLPARVRGQSRGLRTIFRGPKPA